MGLEFFTSSYTQYKADTDAVATWLVATAKKCGFPVETLRGATTPATPAAPQSKRLKGKARKLAKETGAKPESSANPVVAKHTLAVKDFVSLADYIAASTSPRIRVPEGFAAVLNRAIAVRRRHGLRFSDGLGLGVQDQESDERHNYFIGILEHVQQALRPLMPSTQVNDPLTRRADDDSVGGRVDNLANRFDGLDVQEPSEAFLRAPDVTISTFKDDTPDVDYEAELRHDAGEALVAFSLLLKDYRELRRLLMTTWASYGCAEFDLVSVSLMTNSAFDIAQRMEEEIQHLFVKIGGSEGMLKRMFVASCILKEEDANFREQPGDDMNFRVYEDAQTLMYPTWLILSAFREVVQKRNVPQYRPGYYGHLDRTRYRNEMSGKENFLHDKMILMEILPEFVTLHRIGPAQSYEDEFTRGLRKMFDTKEIPLWLVFAAQVFLDIHRILRDDFQRPHGELAIHAETVGTSIRKNMAFHADLRIDNWPKQNDKVMQHILDVVDMWVHTDMTMSLKQSLKLIWRPGDEFKLTKWHPVLCGMITYYLKSMWQEIGITFAGAWGSIMYSAHLYNALQQEKLMSGAWFDMDLILYWHPEIFVGARPARPEDYLKRFNLSTGVSATAYGRNRRHTPRLPESRSGPKGIQPIANISRMFFERYCEGSRKTGFSAAELEKILADGVWEIELEGQEQDQDGDVLTMSRRVGNKESKLSNSKSSARQRWDTARRLTPTELLTTLRNTLQVEAPEMNFDYLTLHQLCWQMLRRLHAAVDPFLRRAFGPEYMEAETQLPFLVGWIFMVAAGTDEATKKLRRDELVTVKSGTLAKAGEVVSEMMVEDGVGDIVKRALERLGYVFEVEEGEGESRDVEKHGC
ncbi:uncharacterized protein DSM5745_05928 [Aspergillus mulundensis]|uniref:DUF6604 domain-containing protein n=1 Tax=Aspergillus mulundensis TaxID=1810919 RepID=A0A3D8RYH7_9EURO|nr:hypothetical protein DSM5745_05928 [Aspergillus mulundensis]RDW79076.1 hypothetical protein DSM5745_05928 [Aspergillus mulundensis]